EFNPWQIVGALFILTLAGAAVVAGNRYNQRIEGNIDRSYDRLARWAPWLGVPLQPSHTPYERADLLAGAIPEGREPLFNLFQQYVLRRFSRDQDVSYGFNSRREWQVLRPQMLRRMIRRRLPHWLRRD
ncbi:MAG: hypothetical protein R3300_14475, partial [Candidatus Promineifilaceae bacterium]|nr:hypothetical protein [Candidatus Promineifilaceae bacterium]